MIMSVSTLIMSSGAATPRSWRNGSMASTLAMVPGRLKLELFKTWARVVRSLLQIVTPNHHGGLMSSEVLHVPRERLSKQTLMLHYAIVSLMEELEAVDWYCQHADDTDDPEL